MQVDFVNMFVDAIGLCVVGVALLLGVVVLGECLGCALSWWLDRRRAH